MQICYLKQNKQCNISEHQARVLVFSAKEEKSRPEMARHISWFGDTHGNKARSNICISIKLKRNQNVPKKNHSEQNQKQIKVFTCDSSNIFPLGERTIYSKELHKKLLCLIQKKKESLFDLLQNNKASAFLLCSVLFLWRQKFCKEERTIIQRLTKVICNRRWLSL